MPLGLEMPDQNSKSEPAVIKEPSPPLPASTVPASTVPSSTDALFASHILMQPSLFVVDISKSENADFAIFSRDLFGRFMFLGASASKILERPHGDLLETPIFHFLSESLCNQQIRTLWSPLSQEENNFFSVEVLTSNGNLIRLDIMETVVLSNHQMVGFVGFIKRSDPPEKVLLSDFEADDRELMQRVASLSAVERQVAELVVDGHMNKRIANLLKVAIRTIETRRARVMSKMRAKSLPHLVQLWLRVRQIESDSRALDESV